MDVGLATASQLAAFRDEESARRRSPRPSVSWFMSATLQPAWLETVDFKQTAVRLGGEVVQIPATRRKGGLWNVKKSIERAASISEPGEVSELALRKHQAGELTLIIVNTVKRAREVFAALDAQLSTTSGRRKSKITSRPANAPELVLIHSQFRGAERKAWADQFLKRSASPPAEGRIIVATQVVEAGVDISAKTLLTDLAPWPSLVQRFGRTARYADQDGQIVVLGTAPKAQDKARPYVVETLSAAEKALGLLIERHGDASPKSLEELEDEARKSSPALLKELFPFQPVHVLRRPDFDELFDTSTDLSGTDIDISRFIRSGEERDVSLFWRRVEKTKGRWPATFQKRELTPPRREELCSVPVAEAREWLGGRQAWIVDYLSDEWTAVSPRRLTRLTPGATILVAVEEGGYSSKEGFTPKSTAPVGEVPFVKVSPAEGALFAATEAEDDESLSEAQWKTIAVHGQEVGGRVREMASALGVPRELTELLILAGRWHDAGKAHEVFQSAIKDEERQRALDAGISFATTALAKAPRGAWRRPAYPARPGFRHELASTLALLELARRVVPSHPSLTSPHEEALQSAGVLTAAPVVAAAGASAEVDRTHPLAAELASLSRDQLDLVAWLVCSHHGKVRCQWIATPHDLDRAEHGESSINGILDGEELPAFDLATAAGNEATVPALTLRLDCANLGLNARYGASWTERVAGLLRHHGPFTLAWLEALLRAADIQASRLEPEVGR